MKYKFQALVRLSRYREFMAFVVVTTLLGASSAQGFFGWRLVGVLVANWLAVAFAFMINDVEDAPEDALNPAKVNRNPVSAGHLSARAGRAASFFVALLAAVAYALLGFWPFVAGFSCLVIGFLYSCRPVRLKTIPFLDMFSHCLMLAGLQFLAAYLAFEPGEWMRWFFPFLSVTTISLYGELFNELRDLDEDVRAGVTHTASLLGRRAAYWLMMTVLAVGVASGLVTVFIIQLLPTWVLLLLAGLAVVLALPAMFRFRRQKTSIELQESFQKPLETAAALALSAQFVGLWALPLFSGLFLLK